MKNREKCYACDRLAMVKLYPLAHLSLAACSFPLINLISLNNCDVPPSRFSVNLVESHGEVLGRWLVA